VSNIYTLFTNPNTSDQAPLYSLPKTSKTHLDRFNEHDVFFDSIHISLLYAYYVD
jgi:hypothetical protein